MSRDFTLDKYDELCRAIRALDRPVVTIRDFLRQQKQKEWPKQSMIVLRHDVDRDLPSALRMAERENAYNLPATYYLRTTPAVFKAEAIDKLSQLGHEVGYHYEVLTKARGDLDRATILFQQEIAEFRKIVAVDTISMHGSPLAPWNNLDIWQACDLADFHLLGEAYLSIDYSDIYYLTDTGRSWDSTRYNIRDYVNGPKPPTPIHSTDDLIRFLSERSDSSVLINAHPNRWTTSVMAWGQSAITDWSINQLKWIVASTYRHFQ